MLHALGGILLLSALRSSRPRSVGIVEVSLLPMPGALADGRAPGDVTGTEKPAGLSRAKLVAPQGSPIVASRPRMRTARVLPPRRDVVAGRTAPRPGLGSRVPEGAPNRPAGSPDPGLPAAPGGTEPVPPTIASPKAPHDGEGDPEAPPIAEGTMAAATGTPEAPDAVRQELPAPDFDLASRASQPDLPGTRQALGQQGEGIPRGRRGTGGATHNRGFLGEGLLAAYYADPPRAKGDYPLNTPFTFPTFTRLVTTRIDPAINFVWDMDPPAPDVPPTYFSVRWTGKLLVPATDTYVFYLDALDDGARLYIDGQMVIDSWMIQQGISVIRAVPLEAGIHDIRVDYCQGPEHHASIRLAWSSSSFGKEIIRARPSPAGPHLVAGLPKK